MLRVRPSSSIFDPGKGEADLGLLILFKRCTPCLLGYTRGVLGSKDNTDSTTV